MQRSTFQKKIRNTRILTITLVVVIFILSITYFVLTSFNGHDYIITVTDKDRIYEGNKEDRDYVFYIFNEKGKNESGINEHCK